MKLSFRQGIVKKQNTMLQKTNRGVTLLANIEPVIITISDGKNEYLYTENKTVNNAWRVNLSNNSQYLLYWDIDKTTGLRTFGYSKGNYSVGNNLPENPNIGDHHFSTSDIKMRVWTGNTWRHVLRCIAAIYNKGVLDEFGVGTQGKIYQRIEAGHIVFNNTSPVTNTVTNSFLTSGTKLFKKGSNVPMSIEQINEPSRTSQNIPKLFAITRTGSEMVLASNQSQELSAVGIASENALRSKINSYKIRGEFYDETFDFKVSPGTDIWLGRNGSIQTSIPSDARYVQRLGYVIDANTIMVDIGEVYNVSVDAS